MSVFSIPTIPAHGSYRAGMRAHCGHWGTVVTITGDIDTDNVDGVLDFASLLMPVGFFAAQSISMLTAVDDLCRTGHVSWSLIPSHAVSRVLQRTNREATLPTASAVPETSLELCGIAGARRPVSLEQAVACL